MNIGVPVFSHFDAVMIAYSTSLHDVSLEASQHGSAGDSRPTEK